MKLKAIKDFKFSYNGAEVVSHRVGQEVQANDKDAAIMIDLGFAEAEHVKKVVKELEAKAVKELETKVVKDLENKSIKVDEKKKTFKSIKKNGK